MTEPVVCIFPHADDEFADKTELQNWLLNDFIENEKPGRYHLRKIGLKDKEFISRIIPGSLILFRKGEYIVGEGIAETGIRKLDIAVEEKYYYDIFVSPNSIRTYELPIIEIEKWCKDERFPTNFTSDKIQTGRYYLIIGSRSSFEKQFPDRYPLSERVKKSPSEQGNDGNWTTGESIAASFPPNVNAIPGEVVDKCYSTLMVAIGSQDNFEARILEAIVHIKVNCPGKNKKVIFEVAKWESEKWKKHVKSFNDIKVILRIKGAHGEIDLT